MKEQPQMDDISHAEGRSALSVGLADAYKRDAERYLWLKDNPDSPMVPYYDNGAWIIPCEISGSGGFGGGVGERRYYSLDDAVDAAMSANV